jgi:transcriptional regulator with XRE-family HTH domain
VERRVAAISRSIGEDIRGQREDAGISKRRLAQAAGVDQSYLGRIESGDARASIETLTAISLALGADLSVRAFPNTGPPLRDAVQAQMTEALLRDIHRRWRRFVEVSVHTPLRGVIDLVLHEPDAHVVVATEVQSQMRRLEQQIRWSKAKAEGLRSCELAPHIWGAADRTDLSCVLLLRSTRVNRDLAVQFEEVLRAAYPARVAEVVAALRTSDVDWPGSALLWMDADRGKARLLDQPPRGVRLGR